ncbi:MAG: histidine kinase [Chitinophagaceae bacterium]
MEKAIGTGTARFNVQQWMLRFLLNDRARVFRHLGMLALIMFILNDDKHDFVDPVNMYVRIGFIIWLLALIYVNMYWLVPRFLFKGRHLAYAGGVFLIMLVGYNVLLLVTPLLDVYRLKPAEHGPASMKAFIAFLFICSILIAASTTLKLFQRWVRDTNRIHELEKLTLQSELKQLKSQINPHFLFNTLNNAHVLTKTDPARSSQVLIKLSELLRYQLYDCAEEQVLLTSDIRFLEDFLNLEKIRRDSFEFEIVEENDMSGKWVSPFLFIPFVENAVKHSLDYSLPSFVHIKFGINERRLVFECTNSIPLRAGTVHQGGLGLANIRRRLELLYPENHLLTVEQKDRQYHIVLSIPI